MNVIWVFAVFAVASAKPKPDVSHLSGYHYEVPHTSYGVPAYQYTPSVSYYGSGFNVKDSKGQYLGSSFSHHEPTVVSHSGFVADSNITPSSLSGFTGLGNGYDSSYTVFNSGIESGLSTGLSNGQYYQTVTPVPSVQPLYIGNENQYQYASAEKYQQSYQIHQQPAQVFKHFYVHTAPEEPEPPKPRTPIVLPPPQKHYKIIFIKTPNLASRNSHIVPIQQQNEEKTIVYVLVKKPDENQEVIIPKIEQKPPSKPEVYFIKYNNKGDDKAVISNIVNDYNKPGQTVSITTGNNDGFLSVPTYAGLPSVTNYPPVSSGFSSVPSGSVTILPSSSGIPNGSSFASVPTFTNIPNESGFSSVPSSPVVSSLSTNTPNFSGISSGSSLSGSSGSSGSSFIDSGTPSSLAFGPGSPTESSGSLSSSSGSFSSLGSSSSSLGSSGSSLGSSGSFSSSLGSSDLSVSPVSIGSLSSSGSSSYESDFSSSSSVSNVNPVSTSSISSESQENLIPTSQGIPHETYGTPKFRE